MERLTMEQWRVAMSEHLKKNGNNLMESYDYMVATYGLPIPEEGTPKNFDPEQVD